MKKRSYLIATILLSAAALSLSSCLKDNRYVDFSKAGNIVDFPKGGTSFFGADAITETPDTDANGTIVRQFAVNVATADVPTTATTVTLAVDNSIIATYNAAHPGLVYVAMPANTFIFTATSVTVPAGQQYATVSVTFNKALLDPSLSYMLPIKIVSATNGRIVSGNMNIHYYHIIGNDFAGAYIWDYTRYNASAPLATPSGGSFTGGAGVINPVTPTEFQMITGYNSQGVRYDVTFDRTVTGSTVAYSNFVVTFVPADVTGIWQAAGISVVQQPVFQVLDPVAKTFTLQYIDNNGTDDRYIIDSYHK